MKKLIALMLVLGLAAAGILVYLLRYQPQTRFDGPHRDITIRAGAGISTIAAALKREQVIENEDLFKLAARVSGVETSLQAGRFRVPAGVTLPQLLDLLHAGQPVTRKITIPEGLTARAVAGLLQEKLDIDSAAFMLAVRDSQFCRTLGVDAPSLEGYLFPETYFLPWDAGPREAAQAMVAEFRRQLPHSAGTLAAARGLTLHEAVTLASIIEGEALLDSEMVTISALYHNRLRRGMRLESDPTIQYIVPDGPRRLLHKDLAIESPYNTYLNKGLPPGPVNNPGAAALYAALHPDSTSYLFMVARGDGSHVFNKTYAAHRKAHAEFNKVRRRVARERAKRAKQGE